MARNKAIFDADILINMVKTNSFDDLINLFDEIYISDYVWNHEIKEGTEEKKVLTKLKNKKKLIVIEYKGLTEQQKSIYKNAYNLLKKKDPSGAINEGERITASFAKAHNVSYYMSDDNKAAPFIKSLADVAVINYCDLLFMAYSKNNDQITQLATYYQAYSDLFQTGCLPRNIVDKKGVLLDFAEVIAKSSDKFSENKKLKDFLELIVRKSSIAK